MNYNSAIKINQIRQKGAFSELGWPLVINYAIKMLSSPEASRRIPLNRGWLSSINQLFGRPLTCRFCVVVSILISVAYRLVSTNNHQKRL